MAPTETHTDTLAAIQAQLDQWAQELGFQQVGITGVDLNQHEGYLQKWLDAGYQGDMHYMTRHGLTRARPADLIPGTCTVLTLRMDYLPEAAADPEVVLGQNDRAYISRYALGRDYHKLMRQRLARLAKRIEAELGAGQYRAFVDSAPVLERALAEQSGLGWIAKNTMLINERAGSWFFLGEIYTDIPFTHDPPKAVKHCGSCTACLDICPTQAFVAPHVLDAGNVFPTSPLSTRAPLIRLCVRSWATAFMAVTTANWCALGINLRSPLRRPILPRATTSTEKR